MPSRYRQQVVDYKYAQLPEDIKYIKKKQKKKVIRSNHKHMYVPCYFKYKIGYEIGTYCSICGRIGDHSILNFQSIEEINPNPEYPIFEREFLDNNKYVII